MDDAPITIEFDLTADDIGDFARYSFVDSSAAVRRLRNSRIFYFVLFGTPTFATVVSVVRYGQLGKWSAALALLAFFVAVDVACAWYAPLLSRKLRIDQTVATFVRSKAAGHWRVTAGPDGLAHRHVNGSAVIPWSDFRDIECSDSAVYAVRSNRSSQIIPVRAFADHAAQAAFLAYADRMIANRVSVARRTSAST